jgi:hypothetical protein
MVLSVRARLVTGQQEITMRAPIITASFLSALFATAAVAQEATPPTDRDPQTLTEIHTQGPTAITGWFVAPTYGVSGGAGAYTAGIRGGIYLDRRFGLGLVANMFGDDRTAFSNDGIKKMGSYSGVLLQYVLQSNRLVHASFETTFGAGRWCAVIDDAHDGCSGKTFLAIEPGANVELNVARHVRVTAGVGYRLAITDDSAGPSTGALSRLVVRSGLVFGSF